jgi:phenylacetate-CoA ligase
MTFQDYTYLLRYGLAKKGALQAYKKAIQNQHLPLEELEDLSWQKTKALLEFAYEQVPWYQRTFKATGLHPKDISKLEYYSQVPILRREDIIAHFKEFIAKGVNPKALSYITTGGSTGTPLKIAVTKNRIREVQKWQLFQWWDTPLNANMASIYRGLPVQGLKKVALDLINWPQTVIRLDATHITTQKIKDFIKAYKNVRPKIIHGYVGAVDAIADYILEHGIRFDFQPNAIWLTAAPIASVQEQKISNAFNSVVCDQYGCSEIFFIAAECPQKTGLHVFADSVKVEVVNSQNQLVEKGTFGKFIFTNLNEFNFPLIRYENGDRGRYLNQACSCGLGLPLIDKVKGRLSDNITLPNGTVVSGEYLTTIFDDYTNKVKKFQVIQHKDLSIIIKVVLYNSSDENYIHSIIQQKFISLLKNKVNFSIKFVEDIKNYKGKLQFVIKK